MHFRRGGKKINFVQEFLIYHIAARLLLSNQLLGRFFLYNISFENKTFYPKMPIRVFLVFEKLRVSLKYFIPKFEQ